ncbi:MAG: septal ring lytic transglycosylase RlpA family protein [Candidatus Omnitrophota bacterium]
MRYVRPYLFIGFIVSIIGFFLQSRLDASLSTVYQASIIPKRYVFNGVASWYSSRSPGIRKHTANNEIFDDQAMTCAMWGVAFNQHIKVTNKANGKSVVVRVNDRGPHRRFVQQGRIIDLTEAAFSQIASPKKGLIEIHLEFL